MRVAGVGPVVSLTYRATVDVPARFRKSKSVGAVFGLTCAKYQSARKHLYLESRRRGRPVDFARTCAVVLTAAAMLFLLAGNGPSRTKT